MSMIIKGMKLPLAGDVMVCALIDGKLQCSIVTRNKPIEWCETLEIPAPHGRLIDKEAIYNNVKSRCNNCHIRACAICGVTRILNDIRTAPTIIEAEASEVDAPKPPECGYIDNEQRTKYAICRPYDGITLNTEVEFLLDHNGDVMLFDSESAAWEYFKPIGITEEEPNAIKVVEYKERENNAGQNDT